MSAQFDSNRTAMSHDHIRRHTPSAGVCTCFTRDDGMAVVQLVGRQSATGDHGNLNG